VIYLLYTLHVLVCVFLILVVLLQQGKGADLSVFGGGSTQTAFGARGATTLLHKITVISFIVFVVTTLLIGIPQFSGNTSVMRDGSAARKPATAPARRAPGPAPQPQRQSIPVAPAPGRTPAPAPGTPAPASKAPPATPVPPPAPAPAPGTPR
jgi:preprotein translocase subunit SecG